MTYIYMITNNINHKIYIGKTIDIEKRWKRHKYLAETGKDRHLYNAMREYGIQNFSISIIETCESKFADERENFWILYYKSYDNKIGYNKSFGGEGGNTWILNSHKEQTSLKLSAALKGHVVSEETRRKISESHKGKTLPQNEKLKISETLKRKYKTGELTAKPIPNKPDRHGVKHTDEARRKMSESKKGKTYEEIYGENANKIRERQRINFSGNKNPRYKEVSNDEIYNMICNGCSNKEICEEFSISERTLIDKMIKIYNKKPTEIRNSVGLSRKYFIFENYNRG